MLMMVKAQFQDKGSMGEDRQVGRGILVREYSYSKITHR